MPQHADATPRRAADHEAPGASPRPAAGVPPAPATADAAAVLAERGVDRLDGVLARAVQQRAVSRLDRARTRTRPTPRGHGNRPLTPGQLGTLWKDVLSRRLEISAKDAATLAKLRGSGRVIDEVVEFWQRKPDRVSADDAVTLLSVAGRPLETMLALLTPPPPPDSERRVLTISDVAKIADRTAGANPDEVRALAQARRTLSVAQIALIANRTGDWPTGDVMTLVERRPPLSAQHVVGLADAPGRSLPQVLALLDPKLKLSAADAVTLLSVAGRPLDTMLALLAPRQRRVLTIADVAKIADGTVGVAPDHVRRLAQTKRPLSAAQIARIAQRTADWPIDDVVALVDRRPELAAKHLDYLLGDAHGRSQGEIVALLNHALKLSGADVVRLAAAGRTADDLTALALLAPQAAGSDLALLGSVPGLGMPEIQVLAQALPTLPGGRTATELVDLVTQTTRALTAGEAVQLANVPGRTPRDLKDLLGHALGLSIAEVEAIGRANRTAAHLTELGADPLSLPRAEAVSLASLLGRSIDDVRLLAGAAPTLPAGRTLSELVALAALGGATPTLTAQEAIDLAAVDRDFADIQLLAAVKPNLLAGRTVADLVRLANLGPSGDRRLTAAGIVALLRKSGVPATMSIAELEVVIDHLDGIDGVKIKEVVKWLHPSLSVADATDLCETLADDGLCGADIHEVVKAFNDAGATGALTKQHITALRTTYRLADATDIVAHTGTRSLTGPMLKLQMLRGLAGGAGALTRLERKAKQYPDGTSPSNRNVDQLWEDCDLNRPARTMGTRTETLEEQRIRQRLALDALMTRAGHVALRVQRIFEHEEGREPRAVKTPAQEDALSGGHIVSRHVLDGTPEIGDEEDLALRALGHRPGAHSPAGAFSSAGDAQSAMQDALDQMLQDPASDWKWMRGQLAKNLDLADHTEPGINPSGVKMTSQVGMVARPALPPYSNPGGRGTSPLHDDDDFMDRSDPYWAHRQQGNDYFLKGYDMHWIYPYVQWTGFAPGAPLCTRNAAPPNVRMRILAVDCEGGFAFHSAWPE